MRFAKLGNQIIAFSRIEVYVGGKGKQKKVRIFSENEPLADLTPETFRQAVIDGTIQRLDLPHSLRTWAEDLSEKIGGLYTPQEALRIMQTKLQDHATTLNTRSATAGEGRHDG